MHLGVDADTGEIVAATLTDRDEDDAAQVGPLLDQIEDPVASFTADGAYDQDRVYADVAERHPEADVVVPPRSTAVPSESAETAPTRRDRHLQLIAEEGRMGWQKASGYNARARAEAAVGRFKQVIGDGLRSRTNGRRVTEVNIGVYTLNRMLELGRPESVRGAQRRGWEGRSRPQPRAAPARGRARRGRRAPDLPRSEHRGRLARGRGIVTRPPRARGEPTGIGGTVTRPGRQPP